jgi:Domain of unknown function (DUF4395)
MSTCTLSTTTRRRLAMQGFTGLDDTTLAEIGPWLRVAPAICSVLIAIATLLAIPIALWALMLLAVICAIRGIHPFDLPYNLGLRHLLGTRPLPRYDAPRRFACLLAALCLGITGSAFFAGVPLLGYALGAALVLAIGVAAATDFCMGCFIHWHLIGAPGAREKTPH